MPLGLKISDGTVVKEWLGDPTELQVESLSNLKVFYFNTDDSSSWNFDITECP